MTDFMIPASKNNAQAQMASGLSAAGDTIQLNSGESSLLPAGAKGSATSAGTRTTLNSTGIGANVSVDQFIRNVTDGSRAWIVSVSADSITTTKLIGGSDNTWESADEWVVGSFYAWLSKKDADGVDTTRELVLVEHVDSAADQVKIETRAVEGSATIFSADDYISVYISAQYPEELGKGLAELMQEKAQDDETVHNIGNETIAGVKTFADDSARSATNAAPVDEKSFTNKKYVDDEIANSAGTDIEFTAGTDMTAGTIFRYGAGFNNGLVDEIGDYDSNSTGYISGTNSLSQGDKVYIKMGTPLTHTNLKSVSLRARTGSSGVAGSTTFGFKIFNESAGLPTTQVGSFTDTLIFNATGTVVGFTMNFDELRKETLVADTDYFLEIELISSAQGILFDAQDSFSLGDKWINGGAPIANFSNVYRLNFTFMTPIIEDETKMFPQEEAVSFKDVALGVVKADVLEDATFLGQCYGIYDGWTGLTSGSGLNPDGVGGYVEVASPSSLSIAKAITSNKALLLMNHVN